MMQEMKLLYSFGFPWAARSLCLKPKRKAWWCGCRTDWMNEIEWNQLDFLLAQSLWDRKGSVLSCRGWSSQILNVCRWPSLFFPCFVPLAFWRGCFFSMIKILFLWEDETPQEISKIFERVVSVEGEVRYTEGLCRTEEVLRWCWCWRAVVSRK